jgi:hypothetical protein
VERGCISVCGWLPMSRTLSIMAQASSRR